MKEEFEKILEEQIFLWNEPNDPIDWKIAGHEPAAAEIARLVDDEFAEAITKALDSYIIQLDARRELNDELRAENTQLLAQLAGMAGRLEEIHDYIERYVSPAWRDFHVAEIFVMVEEALSAAPEQVNQKQLTMKSQAKMVDKQGNEEEKP